jgi:hypothetical protein
MSWHGDDPHTGAVMETSDVADRFEERPVVGGGVQSRSPLTVTPNLCHPEDGIQ